jgi:hypothetical protein
MRITETNRVFESSSRQGTMFVAMYYVLTILTGAFLLVFHGRSAFATDLIASACYLGVTAVFYDLSKPGNTGMSRRK